MTNAPPPAEASAALPATDGAAAQKPAARVTPAGGVGVTIAKNSIWLLIDNFAGMAASFYCSILVARQLGPDFMGHYNYVLVFASVLRMLTEVAIPVTVRKFAAELMGRGDYVMLKTLVKSALRLQGKLAVVGVSAGLIFVVARFPDAQRSYAILAVLTILPGLFLSIPTGALWATENLRYNVIASLGATTVNMIGVTLSVFLRWGFMGLMASLLASKVFDACLRFIMFRQRYALLPGAPLDRIDPALRRRILPFAGQQVVLSALYTLLFDRMLEVFFLKAFSATREIAFFSISFTVSQYLIQIPQQISGSVGASLMVKQGRSPAEAARLAATATWFLMLVAAPMLFGAASVADPLLRLLYGARYLPAIPVLTLLSLFGLALAVSSPAQYLLAAAERQIFYIGWLSVAGVITLVGNLALVPSLGALGATYAKGASQIVAAIGFLVYLVRHFRVSLPLGRMAKLLGTCALMFACVHLTARALPALLSLLVGIPLGAVVFVLVTRLLRTLDGADGDRLRQLQRMVPGSARGFYLSMVRFLVPTA